MAEKEYSGSSLYRYVLKQFGCPMTWTERVVQVDIYPTQIATVNPRRFSLLVSNFSSVPVCLGFSAESCKEAGIYLTGEGGTFILIASEDGELVGSALYARSAKEGTVNLYILEVYGLE